MSGRVGSITTDIISDGLIFNIDAANRASYPRTGTNWIDTINSNNCTLTNSPVFENENAGGISFDASDDYGRIPHSSILNLASTGGTICGAIEYANTSPANSGWFSKRVSDANIPYHMGQPVGTTKIRLIANNNTTLIALDSITQIGTNTPAVFAASFATNGDYKMYINGALDNNRSGAVTLIDNTAAIIVADGGNNGSPMTGNYNTDCTIYCIQVYNRVLSAAEVLHNYNALRGRFGV